MKRLGFWLITLLVILGALYTLPRGNSTIPSEYATLTLPANLDSSDTIAAGREIFLANCVPCHGVFGNGQGTTKPTFGPQPADFTDHSKVEIHTPQYLFWRVSEGGQVEPFRSQGSIMPAWKYQLSEQQRWQVIAYIRTLAR
jgi:mono/diheme cytochrome c family protein